MYNGKIPALHVKRSADEVVAAAIMWGVLIAGNNNFHYGHGDNAHHNGCYFCGTNTLKGSRTKTGIKDYLTTYCCNPFVHACYAHGGLVPSMLTKCQQAKSLGFSAGSGYDTSKLFKKLGKPAKANLKAGYVLCSDTHVMLFIGDGKVVHAGHEDDNNPGSKSWNTSIRTQTLSDSMYKKVKRVYQFTGSVDADIAIRFGEISDRVKDLQTFLNWSGGYGLDVDGIFFEKTRDALTDWQGKNGLAADGIAGPATIRKMEDLAKPVYTLPTAEQIRAASNAGIHIRMCLQADAIAKDGRYHYVTWTSKDPKTKECPICKKHAPGRYFGWNCIGFAFHCWHHAGLPSKCNCSVVSNGNGETLLKCKTDAEAIKKAQDWIGLKDLTVIRNKNGIPTNQMQPGDIILLFDGETYHHTIISKGGTKYADCTSGRKPNIKSDVAMSARVKAHAKVLIRYTGGFSYLQLYDRGDAVKLLQIWLNGHGYACDPDGIFGPATEKALKAYQTAAGLTVDGLAGPATLKAMGEEVNA